MMRGDRRTLIIGGALLALIACSAALGLRLLGGAKQPGAKLVNVARRGSTNPLSEGTEAAAERSFDDYRIMTQRNVFRPLVSPPQDKATLEVPAEIPSATGAAAKSSSTPSKPPDPTADLAMTGVVESDAGLRALITNINTGISAYVGVGGEAFNLRVTRIEAKRVTLARGDERYTLVMGQKEVPPEAAASEPSAMRASGATAPSQEQRGEPRRGPFGPGGRGFGSGEMLRRLEQARRAGRLSPQQYERARRSIDERRRRERGR